MRIHQSTERVHLLTAHELDRSDLNDVIGFGVDTCRFKVEGY